MENRISTTIDQSKELVRLGLDPKTADMVWMSNKWLYSIKDNILNREQFYEHDTLAWSLSALLEVMSKVTCISYLTIDTSYLIRCKDLGFLWQKDIAAKDPIIAAYEMVCWLLEQGLIEKGGQDDNNHQ